MGLGSIPGWGTKILQAILAARKKKRRYTDGKGVVCEKMSTSYVTGELQIKTTMSYHSIPIKMAKIQNTTPKVDEDVEQQELSFIAGGNEKWYSHFGRQFSCFLQN